MSASARQQEQVASHKRWQRAWPYALLLSLATAPRLWLAFGLSNPDGDAYAYLQTIESMRASLVAGTFSLKTLFNSSCHSRPIGTATSTFTD